MSKPKPPPKPYHGTPPAAAAKVKAPKKSEVLPAPQIRTPKDLRVAMESCSTANGDAAGKPRLYPGAKAGSGVAEAIIAQMPPHAKYIECFAGHASVFRRKRPAMVNCLIDLDPAATDWLTAHVNLDQREAVTIVTTDAVTWLERYCHILPKATLIYADPPYLGNTRTRPLYEYEFDAPEQHRALLDRLRLCKCLVMVSGYDSVLYSDLLHDWRRVDIASMTRGGARTECLWCNFPAPERLHDPRFAGSNFRERERIKRKRLRWQTRFAAMPARERQVIAEALVHADPAAAELAMRSYADIADIRTVSTDVLATYGIGKVGKACNATDGVAGPGQDPPGRFGLR